MSKKKITFEDAMKQLEEIVTELEAGDPPLEKAIQQFEEGMELVRICSKKLEEIENKITILLQKNDGTVEEEAWEPHEPSTSS
ncbi:MAG: exodeoxyribonuclease VII small subunit [Desulfobacteraceae bacterium]|jgi:exodeoxyribonuclease VII small subunit|nr:exodeoxyribonuclease VII small subunit [Desulfobacteraceae bacterium]